MMTNEDFRADLLASAGARAEAHETSLRDGFVSEVLERLCNAGEVPDAESCSETHIGQNRRRLEVDAYAYDDADESLNLFLAIQAGPSEELTPLSLTEARQQGFNRLLGVFEQARDGWLVANIEESRPLSELARRIQTGGRPTALRLHILSDRPMSDYLREIPPDRTKEGVPVTFHIWDLTRLQRVHEAVSVRSDLFIDLSEMEGGGLTALPAAVGEGDYDAYLAVIPGEILADIYIRHGSRLLEGNVRTFLGRRGNINRGIAATLSKEPSRFFAYNNGIATTASEVRKVEGPGGTIVITGITDLQIVNGAQTTASLATLRRDRKLPVGLVSVPMKLSVLAPSVAEELIPKISRFANSQNSVRASDFFANHLFHQRMEGISRRILAPAKGGSLTQTHWYYERARGQHLNDQAGLMGARKDLFLRQNPKNQVITKTDLAKVESCFDLLPDIACKGAEKAFVAFAERVTEDWKDNKRRDSYGDDWFRSAVARNILFRTAEGLVSNARWYEGGYRAQIVAYTAARLSALASEMSNGGRLNYLKVWTAQAAGPVLERQLLMIAETMTSVLRSPPLGGQNISEWAKQQACRNTALQTAVEVDPAFEQFILDKSEVKSDERDERDKQRVTDGLEALSDVMNAGAEFWVRIRQFATARRLATPEDVTALGRACTMPAKLPSDWQAIRLLALKLRCEDAGLNDQA